MSRSGSMVRAKRERIDALERITWACLMRLTASNAQGRENVHSSMDNYTLCHICAKALKSFILLNLVAIHTLGTPDAS